MNVPPLTNIARDVAKYLGSAYSADEDAASEGHAVIRCRDQDPQFGILFYHNHREKRLVLSPCLPRARDGTEFPYSHKRTDIRITVAENRPPAAIAAEIVRRFLPDYIKLFSEGLRDCIEHDAYTSRQAENLRRIADLLGGTVRGETVDVPMGNYERFGYIRQLQAGNNVDIDLRSCPPDIAIKVLTYWKGLQTETK